MRRLPSPLPHRSHRARTPRGLPALAGLLLLLGIAGAGAQSPPSPAQAYRLRVRLDETRARLVGRLDLTFRNTSHAALDALWFHLYANAFAHTGTVFMREGGSSVRNGALERPGSLHVTRLVVDNVDLLDQLDTELVPGDRTQARLPLPSPLPPDARLGIEIDFETELPNLVARMGFADGFFMLAQWFPKLAKLEPDGHFASFPYHGLGEFYADFAEYDLELDVPGNSESLCGGTRMERRSSTDGRRNERYHLSPAHDIACAVAMQGRTHVAQAGPVTIEFLAPQGYDQAVARQLLILRDGLAFFGKHFGPYPYAHLGVVIPPRDAHAASGMEYPGLIVTAGPWWSLPIYGFDPFHDVITAHELGHQWFYGMLASDEVTHPFMDEGLTEWATWALLQWRHDRGPPHNGPSPTALLDALGAFALAQPGHSSLLSVADYHPGELAQAVYLQPALALERLADRHGRQRVLRALGVYARAHRFGHPTPQDLFEALDQELAADTSGAFLRPRLRGSTAVTANHSRTAPGTDRSAAEDSWLTSILALAQWGMGWLGP